MGAARVAQSIAVEVELSSSLAFQEAHRPRRERAPLPSAQIHARRGGNVVPTLNVVISLLTKLNTSMDAIQSLEWPSMNPAA